MNSALSLPPITTDLEVAKAHLDEYGLARLGNALSIDEVAALRTRLLDQAAAEVAQGKSYHDGSSDLTAAGGPNQRIWNLINKGRVFHSIPTSPRVLALVKHMLGDDVLLSSITANIARRSGTPMMIHTDQNYVPVVTPYPAVADVAWMLDDFTEENGATRVIPGSHKWGRYPQAGESPATVAATGPAGTALVFDGRLWHGTGANTTAKDRPGLFTYYCRAFIRQQENFSLSIHPEVLAKLSPELLELLGFRVWHTLGMVEGARHGQYNLRPESFSHEMSVQRDR
jgi:ectoine hydroxylase-related dioxygenase (phytanoyl-CoA dioxygenase family)